MKERNSHRVFVGFAKLRYVAKVGYVKVVMTGCEGEAENKNS
jgi:hypothetical protein